MRDLVHVLAEPTRRRLLEILLDGEQSVTGLSAHFGVTRSAISQHLSVLAKAGLVDARQVGRFRYYRVNAGGLTDLRASLEVFWTRELDELAAAGPPRGGVKMAVEKSVLVPLTADETFALMTEPDRLRRWQTVTARIDLRAGGSYRWTIVPGHTAAGHVVEVEPGKRLVLSWGWEDTEDLPPGASTVIITLEPTDGGTMVRLVHEGLTDEQSTSHGEGWSHYLERLATAARTGDAGADQWGDPPAGMDSLTAAEASLALCQLVLRGVDDKDRTAATPCAKFTVEELVDHLLGSITGLGAMAGATVDVSTSGASEARVADAAQQALEAWRVRGVDGDISFAGRPMPASLAAGILSIEFLVHAWDLATATSQPLAPSEALNVYVLETAHNVIAPQMRDGDRFADVVEVGSDADGLERLVAFTGRTP